MATAVVGNAMRIGVGAPTLAVVSVRLFSVVDLPEDGLPTKAMRGSRGMLATGGPQAISRQPVPTIGIVKEAERRWKAVKGVVEV